MSKFHQLHVTGEWVGVMLSRLLSVMWSVRGMVPLLAQAGSSNLKSCWRKIMLGTTAKCDNVYQKYITMLPGVNSLAVGECGNNFKNVISRLVLTHWGRVTHICISRLTIIGSDNGLSPGWCQAIIWTDAGILLIGPLGTNFSEILVGIHIFFQKNALEDVVCVIVSISSQPQCVKDEVSEQFLWNCSQVNVTANLWW